MPLLLKAQTEGSLFVSPTLVVSLVQPRGGRKTAATIGITEGTRCNIEITKG